MTIFVDAVDASNHKSILTVDSELLQSIPDSKKWKNCNEDGKLLFSTQYEVIVWLREVVDFIPTTIKTFDVYHSYTDTIKTTKGSFTRPGRMLLKSIYANEMRKESYVEPLHTKKAGRPRKDEDDYDESSDFEDWEELD